LQNGVFVFVISLELKLVTECCPACRYVLAGRGTLRLGEERIAVRSGDWIALPCGPGHAHQLINDGDLPLEYLCVSTMIPVDVWGYPDSHKLGVGAAPPGGGLADRYLKKWFPDDVEAWSLRWVLLHLVEEIGRHAGHADIVRESIDGATMYELMAGAEGWPATDWLQPWTPPTT